MVATCLLPLTKHKIVLVLWRAGDDKDGDPAAQGHRLFGSRFALFGLVSNATNVITSVVKQVEQYC